MRSIMRHAYHRSMPERQLPSRPKIIGFDHLVLVVDDVEKSLAWYCGELGLAEVNVDEWRAGKAFFPSARIDATSIIDFLPRKEGAAPAAGGGDANAKNLDHICLVVEPTDLSVLGKTGPRSGAQGIGTSVYLEDPDGNTVELRHY